MDGSSIHGSRPKEKGPGSRGPKVRRPIQTKRDDAKNVRRSNRAVKKTRIDMTAPCSRLAVHLADDDRIVAEDLRVEEDPLRLAEGLVELLDQILHLLRDATGGKPPLVDPAEGREHGRALVPVVARHPLEPDVAPGIRLEERGREEVLLLVDDAEDKAADALGHVHEGAEERPMP